MSVCTDSGMGPRVTDRGPNPAGDRDRRVPGHPRPRIGRTTGSVSAAPVWRGAAAGPATRARGRRRVLWDLRLSLRGVGLRLGGAWASASDFAFAAASALPFAMIESLTVLDAAAMAVSSRVFTSLLSVSRVLSSATLPSEQYTLGTPRSADSRAKPAKTPPGGHSSRHMQLGNESSHSADAVWPFYTPKCEEPLNCLSSFCLGREPHPARRFAARLEPCLAVHPESLPCGVPCRALSRCPESPLCDTRGARVAGCRIGCYPLTKSL
jgi:hypothetical protein